MLSANKYTAELFIVNSTNFLKNEIAFLELQISSEHMLHDGKNLLLSFLPN